MRRMPVLSREQIEGIAEKHLYAFRPEYLQFPQPVDVDKFAVEYLHLRQDYQYLSNNGIYLGMYVFDDTDRLAVYDEKKNEARYISEKADTIIIDKSLLEKGQEGRYRFTMGHEIGHVVKRHTVHQLEKNMWTQLAAILAGVASGNGDVLAMGMVVGDALAAGYSRADESAADREGFAYTVKAGYSPYAMLVTMHKLQELAAEYGNPGWGIFDSHPDPAQRIRNMYKLMDPLKMTPSPVLGTDGIASVKETFGNSKEVWSFDIAAAAGGNKPMYRAELLAGSLYQVRQKDKIEPSHFIVFESNDKAEIYYEDIQLYTVYKQDAAGFAGIGACAADCVERFREWAEKVNRAKPVAKQ